MSEAVETFMVINNDFEKRPIEDILKDSENIDPKQIALEIIGWAIENVENYIDNTVRIFKLDLVLDAEETMQETKALQNLYRSIPNDEDLIEPDVLTILKDAEEKGGLTDKLKQYPEAEEAMDLIQDCREALDKITKQAHEEFGNLTEHMDKLSERLVYYYEMKGVKDGVPLIQDLDGSADIIKFEYEAFNVGVKVKKFDPNTQEEAEEIVEEAKEQMEEEGEIVSEYVVPEGFTLWIEIACKDKLPLSMF